MPEVSAGVKAGDLAVAAVLSGNRNFEGRVNPDVQPSYLASPPLVVAYAIAGTVDIDLYNEPIGTDPKGNPVYLKDIWPTNAEIRAMVDATCHPRAVHQRYASQRRPRRVAGHPGQRGRCVRLERKSTYVRSPLLRRHEA
jgi:aconitate hydratase